MVFAKRIKDGVVVSLMKYNYTPTFSENSSMVVISEEEYNALRQEMREKAKAKAEAEANSEK